MRRSDSAKKRVADDQPLAAARLQGAAAALRSLTGAFLTIDALAVADLRRQLAGDLQREFAFQEALQEGGRLNQAQAVAYALSLSNGG